MFALSGKTDPYPQRRNWDEPKWLERKSERLRIAIRSRLRMNPLRQRLFVARVLRRHQRLAALDDAAVTARVAEVRRQLRRQGLKTALVAECFALVRLLSERELGMSHYPVQLRGAWLMLHGQLAEMDTGEGKTLTATLTAATAALAGFAVQVVTVNEYLAERDSAQMRPLYARLGLTTGLVGESTPLPDKPRQYQADITYCTNKTLVFDYLRDRIAYGDRMRPLSMTFRRLAGEAASDAADDAPILPGLQFAIVDEADSIFIDEARTPLVISASGDDKDAESYFQQAIELARSLQAGEDFEVPHGLRGAELTAAGREHLQQLVQELPALWHAEHRREEGVAQALTALHSFQRDVHYIVREDKVLIVDQNTGRVMPDRSWERGLQQLIEAKEQVPVTPDKTTLARISFQLFFRRYLHLAGMSGTCREVRGELAEIYGIGVVRVPPNRDSRRRRLRRRVYADAAQRWQAVADAIRERHARGQPVLVGTRSIRASEIIHELLQQAGIEHQLLNAKQDAEEAAIVAGAGQPGSVTIATNMAGRGTDIKLPEGVTDAGGLHVILTEGHDTPRVDRQLIGRCARQGEPGTWETLLSLEDEVLEGHLAWLQQPLAALLDRIPRSPVLQALALAYYRSAQRSAERRDRRIRQQLLAADFRQRQSLSFSGQME